MILLLVSISILLTLWCIRLSSENSRLKSRIEDLNRLLQVKDKYVKLSVENIPFVIFEEKESEDGKDS